MKDTTQIQAGGCATGIPTPSDRAWSPELIDLYTTRFDQLVRCAQWVVRDRSLAEECVQEAFMSYHVKQISPRPGSEYGYLRTMVRNGAISMVRAQQRGREIAALLPEPCPEPSPETIVLAHIAAADLGAHLRQLAPRQAEVIELRLAGLSVGQTAQQLDVTDGTVKTHRHRAAKALLPHFGEVLAA